jgi:hypothetical protein
MIAMPLPLPPVLKAAIAAALLLALAACQPLPQPFQHAETGDNPLVVLKDGPGVSLRPIEGLDLHLSDEITTALEQAFAAEDVSASALAANRASFRLVGKGTITPQPGGRTALAIDWLLSDASGAELEQRRQETVLVDGVAHRDSLIRMAQELAAGMVPRLASPSPKSVLPEAVLVRGVDGAPGDGGSSLKQAIEYVLSKNGVPLAQKGEDNVLVVMAQIVMGRPEGDAQSISIRWTLRGPDGAELGNVTQANKVRAGSLDHAWGDTAYAVAEAAYDGIGALLQKVWVPSLKPVPGAS